MTDLIKRLDAAESGSFELDHLIAEAVYPNLRGFRNPGEAGWDGPGWSTRPPPPYTVSLDAALALIAEKSPLRGPIMLSIAGSGCCGLEDADPCGPHIEAFGNTPALACCIALLRAISQGDANG